MLLAQKALAEIPEWEYRFVSLALKFFFSRLHNKSLLTKPTTTVPFDSKRVPKSTTLHLDYTGQLPERCDTGTLFFLVACHGSYIHLEPLPNLRGPETAAAITAAVAFSRNHGVILNKIRMDNQSSPEVRAAATTLHLTWELVNPYQKEPNRAERAIRTAKNHIIATRAGFHRECPHTYLDKCLFQMERAHVELSSWCLFHTNTTLPCPRTKA
jgi:hypothetical protein